MKVEVIFLKRRLMLKILFNISDCLLVTYVYLIYLHTLYFSIYYGDKYWIDYILTVIINFLLIVFSVITYIFILRKTWVERASLKMREKRVNFHVEKYHTKFIIT